MRRTLTSLLAIYVAIFLTALGTGRLAAAPTAEQALKLTPVQEGVDYTKPTAAETEKCTISVKKLEGQVGWVVEDANGMTLRRFVDTNGDNVVDQWSYYKDGVEVYRDVDSDFNGKADQYRWFNTAGSRWALDKNEDGRIDSWKTISAEEVTAEVIAALAQRNADRFDLVAITPEDVKSLGLGKQRTEKLLEKAGNLVKDFRSRILRQSPLAKDAQWAQFSGGKPGVVPAGTDGSTKDVHAYENVVAIAESADKNVQVSIGTLVQVGDGWRVIDAPLMGEGQADAAPSGFFFQAAVANRGELASSSGDAPQKLLSELEELDKAAPQMGSQEKQAQYTAQRADLLEKIGDQARAPADRAMWYRQLADMLSAGVQSGVYPDGVKRLKTLFEKLSKNDADKDLAGYYQFRLLTADYGLALQAKNADFPKIQIQWLKNLEQYVDEYPTSADSAEAMLQLAIAQEFAGQEDEAHKWYGRIIKEFGQSPAAQKAVGAQRRLDSVGKPLALSGKSPNGSAVDTSKFRGKAVLIQYWATWSEPSKTDMATLRDLAAKYRKDLVVVGVNLDTDPRQFSAYLAQAKLPWPQIFEEGGLDSRPANQLGIITVPTMILLDQQGRVVDRAISTADLEDQLKKLIR